jgi:hypothetical protein
MQHLRSFYSSITYDAEKQDEDHYKTILYYSDWLLHLLFVQKSAAPPVVAMH